MTATRPSKSPKVKSKVHCVFQYPKKNSLALDAVWHEARQLEINSLAKLMKTICEKARLSKIYASYCVRSTAITLWSNAGISNRHIMAISGHRSRPLLGGFLCPPSEFQTFFKMSQFWKVCMSLSKFCPKLSVYLRKRVLLILSLKHSIFG